jgi:hypothetical protein
MGKLVGRGLVGVLFLAWLAAEVAYIVDNDPDTWPLTKIVVTYVPWPILAAVLAWFVAWITPHFAAAYRKEGKTMSFKFEPVKWMTVTLGVLVALASVSEFMDLLPDKVQTGVLIAITLLTAILGKQVRDKVTPLAAPQNEAGQPLVPVNGKSTVA